MSDPSSQPTQPLTDEELARTMLARRRGAVQSLNGCDCMQPDSHGIVLDSLGDIPRLLAEVSRLRADNTAQAEQLDRATKLANQLCNCDSYDCPPTEPATGAPLRHHCECAALLMETALDPAQGHQHEPCLTNDARALGLDQDGRGQ